MENPVIYLDLNREFAQIKEEEYKSDWTNEIDDIYLPKGSTIQVQNALLNIQGIEGGSIEIREDQEIVMYGNFYLSHSDYPSPKYTYDLTDNNIISINGGDQWENETDLNSLYVNSFVDANRSKLVDTALNTKLTTTPVQLIYGDGAGDITSQTAMNWLFSNETSNFGGTEQPLFAVFVNDDGYIEPLIKKITINIPKGIYGISQLSSFITNQLQSKPYDMVEKLNRTTNVLLDDFNKGDYTGVLHSQTTENGYAWGTEYYIDGDDITDFNDIIEKLSVDDLSRLSSETQGGKYIYILGQQFNRLMQDWGNNYKNNPIYIASTFFANGENYYASIQGRYLHNLVPKNAVGLKYYINKTNDTIDYEDFNVSNNFWNYQPLASNYTIGAIEPLLQYDGNDAGYSISQLHTSRVEMSHDYVGNKLENEGKNVSHYKGKQGVLDSVLTFPALALTTAEKKTMNNAMLNPRQRTSGICIYNWDYNLMIKEGKAILLDGGVPADTNKYRHFQNGFKDIETAEKGWKDSFWFRIGFQYNQLNYPSFTNYLSFDLPQIEYGITTNNNLDVSIQPSLCSSYCPSQSANSTTYINSDMPYTLLSQQKTYDLMNEAMTPLGWYNNLNYKTLKCAYYIYQQTYSILTDSLKITANKLPILSDEGYFLITSDIVGANNDNLRNRASIPLLAVVPKSNLSNQDFMSSKDTIIHTLTQDETLNKVRIRVLNADLTQPYLNEKSAIILKIIKADPIKKSKTSEV